MSKYSKRICVLTVVSCFFISQPAFAQERASVLSDLYICSSISDDADRLSCFDKAVPTLKVKEEKKEIVAIDAEQVREIKRDSFGFSLPSLPKIGLFDKKENDVEKLAQTFKVKSISPRRSGLIITLENGHVWQHTSGDLGRIPKGDLTATIKPASLGSFFVRLENEKGHSGRKGAKIKRIK